MPLGEGNRSAEFMRKLYEETKESPLTTVDPAVIAARMDLESWDVRPIVDKLIRAAYIEESYDGEIRLMDAGRREAGRAWLASKDAADKASAQSPGTSGHAFISYVREDREQVDRLVRVLQAAGIQVWLDRSDLWPGEDWKAKIRNAIRQNALVFIACFSSSSVTRVRSYQNEELVVAVEDLRLRQPEQPWLIPVRLDDCEIPDRDIGGGLSLNSLQRADLFGEGFQDGADRLVAAIRRIIGVAKPMARPEAAATGRNRPSAKARQPGRLREIERDSIDRLDMSDGPWIVTSLWPDTPGHMLIDGKTFKNFRTQITGRRTTILSGGGGICRTSVGQRRLLADGTMGDSPLARWISLELYPDGSGVCGICVCNLYRQDRREPPEDAALQHQMLEDEAVAIAVLSGLLHLSEHASSWAAAEGNAVLRAQIYPISLTTPTRLGQRRMYGFRDPLGDKMLNSPPPAAETTAALADLVPGPALVAAAAALLNEIGQTFGVPEMGQLSREGQLRRPYWSETQALNWAEKHGVEITDDTIT